MCFLIFLNLGLIFEYFDQKVPEKSIFAKNLSTLGISELLVDRFFQVEAKFNSKINWYIFQHCISYPNI